MNISKDLRKAMQLFAVVVVAYMIFSLLLVTVHSHRDVTRFMTERDVNTVGISVITEPTKMATKISNLNELKVPFLIKELIPKEEGNLDLTLHLDLKDLLRRLDKMSSIDLTTNPLPLDPDITLMDKTICDKNPKWVIYIHSAPKNTKRRVLIRSTWGNKYLFKDNRTRVVFLFGKPKLQEEQDIIEREFRMFKDIVQGDFVEDYNNLTLKGIMGLKWVSTYCPSAKFVMKSDDDTFSHIFKLMKFAENNLSENKNTIICPVWIEGTMLIQRDPLKCQKWCVKYHEFLGKKFFPEYCSGIGYVLPLKTARKLYETSKTTPFFWIDDVYITGILPKRLEDKIEFKSILDNFTISENVALDEYTNKKKFNYLFVHVKGENNFLDLWKATLDNLDPLELENLSPKIVQAMKGINVNSILSDV